MTAVECVVEARNTLGEGPTWCPRERVLWWVDVMEGTIQRLRPETGEVRSWSIGRKPHGVALRCRGGLVLTIRNGFWLFEPDSGDLTELRDAAPQLPRNFINDCKCDARGRLWAGSLDRDMEPGRGELYRLDPDLSCHRMDAGIDVSNGIAWSPDDRLLYYADTGAGVIHAYDFEPYAGAVRNRRIFLSFADLPGNPDGITVDQEGFVWSAQFDGGGVIRIAPDGRVDRWIEMSVTRPTSCQFGGDGLDVLYITSAAMGLSEEERTAQPLAGSLFATRPGVRGLPPHAFAG